MSTKQIPKWKDLPAVPGFPQGFAWGVFDKDDGKKDGLGTLNNLSAEAVIAAKSEIQTGVSVALNWWCVLHFYVLHIESANAITARVPFLSRCPSPVVELFPGYLKCQCPYCAYCKDIISDNNRGLEKLHQPGFGRCTLTHKLIDWKQKAVELGTPPFFSYDDEITVNTQTGSQWDGLRHWAHQPTGTYYNGVKHADVPHAEQLGIDQWSKHGGLVGRGILIDFVSYALENNISYDPMSSYGIPLSTLKAIMAEKKIEARAGDILLVRSGWIKWYEENSPEERLKKITHGDDWIGVEVTEELLEWLWDSRFAAVAGDSIGFEVTPLGSTGSGYTMHDYCLAGWGMPIGEMWDLEALAEECKRQKRWSFFFTSAPLNLKGGAASPPNAIAVF